MENIKTVGIVGGGVIGAGWAVRLLARGFDVIASDPGRGAEDILLAKVEHAWPAMKKIGWTTAVAPPRIDFTADLEKVARTADFIQESAPENMELKKRLHADLDRYAPPNVILASSTSGLLPSRIQADLLHPSRFVVGHPFNPVYLLPLIETVAGVQTSLQTLEHAEDFYRLLGMQVLRVRKEVDAFICNRLQESIWRECLHLINDGIATPAELDDAIKLAPGLRWAFMGHMQHSYVSGGEAGIRDTLSKFGFVMELPWTHLEGPTLTGELIEKVAQGSEDAWGDKSVKEWEALRDDCLIAIMNALRTFDIGAGRTLNNDPLMRARN